MKATWIQLGLFLFAVNVLAGILLHWLDSFGMGSDAAYYSLRVLGWLNMPAGYFHGTILDFLGIPEFYDHETMVEITVSIFLELILMAVQWFLVGFGIAFVVKKYRAIT